jgi:hypothetical protein
VYVRGRQLLDAILREIPAQARQLADLVRLRTAGRFQAETIQLARHVGVDWRDVLLANISYDLVVARPACSTVALATPQGPLLARNLDWPPPDLLAQASYLVRYSRAGRLVIATAGWPGAVGVVTGLSARGFALALNAVGSTEKVCWTGYPVLLYLRCVLEDARDFEDALRLLCNQDLPAPALFSLVGSHNEQRVVIERTPTRHAVRWPQGDEPLLATNSYLLLQEFAEWPAACPRYDALTRFFASQPASGALPDAALLYALSDPAVMQDITAQHVLLRPCSGEARLFVPRRLLTDYSRAGG